MRKTGLIDALFPKVRQQILATLLPDAERSWYLRDLAQHLEVTPSSLQRELASLVEAGILAKRQDGNRTYFQAATRCPIFPELRSIFIKTSGLADRVRSALEPISGRIDLAFIFGSMADSTERSWSDVDLFVVGQVKMSDLTRALKPLETSL
ncbi:MAG TPA: nucleotidyltransferase domain-containing protein, partial [Fimbriimonadales bacterium]|nr:nucleotidyltransferase domain-containing protein [Fimbriimonadales bacterium]